MKYVKTIQGFENETSVLYFSGRQFFDETLVDGHLITRFRNGIGLVEPVSHFIPEVYSIVDSSAFQIGINGTYLYDGWKNDEFSDLGNGHSVRIMSHLAAGITVNVHTQLYGGDFVKRWLEIKNTNRNSIGLTKLAPYSGLLFRHGKKEKLMSREDLYSIGYAHSNEWSCEGDFYFDKIDTSFEFVSNRGRSFARPGFWIRDNLTNETFVYEYGFSGNWKLSVNTAESTSQVCLGFSLEMFAPEGEVLRVLRPDETVQSPSCYFGLFKCSDDEIVQSSHCFVRDILRPKLPNGCPTVEFEMNHRGYLSDRETDEKIKRDVDVAAANGMEMYVIDAGWYGTSLQNEWFSNAGDWVSGPWMGKGVADIADYVHEKGMRFGLWAEIEAAGSNSHLKCEHPEWLIKTCNRAIDLSIPEAEEYIANELIRIVQENHVDMYRLDHNQDFMAGGSQIIDGIIENTNWRYFEAFDRIFRRLRNTFPNLLMQACAGGGGRLDWGIIQLFDNFQISDCNRSPRSIRIFNGLTMSLPSELLMKPMGMEMWDMTIDGDLDEQLREGVICIPLTVGIAPSPDTVSPVQKEALEKSIAFLKQYTIPIFENGCRMYHHTPFQPLDGKSEKTILEYSNSTGKKSFVAIFATTQEAIGRGLVYPKSVKIGNKYLVRYANSGDSVEIDGYSILTFGLPYYLGTGSNSEIITLDLR